MKQSGFTLIELVMVIVILGILSVTVAPKFIELSGEARSQMIKAEAASFKVGVNLARAKWIALGSPSNNDARNDVQLWGNNSEGQIDFNPQGWPAQSYSGPDAQELSADGPDDCLSIYTVLIQDGADKAATDSSKDYIVAKDGPGNSCSYLLVEDNTYGFFYYPETGVVTVK